jgi:hypothetical protein
VFQLDQWFVFIAQVLILVFLAATAWKALKQATVNSTVVVGKQTDDHETVTINANFTSFDSRESMKKKIDLLCDLGNEKKSENFERFQALIAAEQEKNKQLKAVQG